MIAQRTSNTKLAQSETRTASLDGETAGFSVDPYHCLQLEKTMAAHLLQVVTAYSIVTAALFLF